MPRHQINPFHPDTGNLATCLYGNSTAMKRLMGKKSERVRGMEGGMCRTTEEHYGLLNVLH